MSETTPPPRDLWYGTSGPHNADIVIVGEAWGEQEAAARRPFVGNSGRELNRILQEAGYERDTVLCTNVIAERPADNEMWRFFEPKSTSTLERVGGLLPTSMAQCEVSRLYRQIEAFPRRLVIAVGNYALWALTNCAGAEVIRESSGRSIPHELQTYGPTGIMSWRGSMWYMLEDRLAPGASYGKTKVLPIIHPAAILRQWALRAVTVHDLKSRVRMALRGDWRRHPQPITFSPPTLQQALLKLQLWFNRADSGTKLHLACDIETVRQSFISVIGFADSSNFAMSIPFLRRDTEIGSFESYWTKEHEAQLVHLIRKVVRHPNILLSGQNFIYDTQYFQTELGCTPRLDFDTMLAQNVMFPGTPKALEYLSSLYCRYHWYWKEDHKDWAKVGNLQVLLDYNCEDCLRTWEIAETQRTLIEGYGMQEQWKLKMKVNGLCLRMMNRGVLIDDRRRLALQLELSGALDGLASQLTYIAPQSLVDAGSKTPWYRSDSKTKTLLYDVLGLAPVTSRKTGRPTTGKEAIDLLTRKHPEWTGLLARIKLYGAADNTAGVLRAGVDPDGRMRCSFNPGGTETHRLSSSKNARGGGMNFQNLTSGAEDD